MKNIQEFINEAKTVEVPLIDLSNTDPIYKKGVEEITKLFDLDVNDPVKAFKGKKSEELWNACNDHNLWLVHAKAERERRWLIKYNFYVFAIGECWAITSGAENPDNDDKLSALDFYEFDDYE